MTSQLGEKVIFEVEAKNRKALGCPRNDPRTSGDGFPSPKLTSIHLVFDFFTKLFSRAVNAAKSTWALAPEGETQCPELPFQQAPRCRLRVSGSVVMIFGVDGVIR
jgi:hypothetical protein